MKNRIISIVLILFVFLSVVHFASIAETDHDNTYGTAGEPAGDDLPETNNLIDSILKLAGEVPAPGDVSNEEPVSVTFVEAEINEISFPDDAFRSFVTQYDQNKDKRLDISELLSVTVMDCKSLGIKSLKGIEFFPALADFDCSRNELTEIDISSNITLKRLDCGSNKIKAVDLRSNIYLEYLDLFDNQLTKLDITNNPELTELRISSNQLSSLDISHNPKLETLYCNFNNLASIGTDNNPMLQSLECAKNCITELCFENNSLLERLRCYGNELKEIDLRPCGNLIIAIQKGSRTKKAEGILRIYKVPGRKEETVSDPIRDKNYYGVFCDQDTKLITK